MRILTLTAAIAALSFGASAGAAPFSFSVTEAEKAESAEKSGNLFGSLIQATAGAFGIEFTSGDKQDEDIILRYFRDGKTCESQPAEETQAEAEKEEKKPLVGPEPIYFGF